MELKPLTPNHDILNICEAIGSLKKPSKVDKEIESIRDRLTEIYNDSVQKYRADIDSKIKELSKYLGKYVYIYYRNPQDDAVVDFYEAFLYRYIPINGQLFGIYNFLASGEYSRGLQDTSVDILDAFKRYKVEIITITKKQFIADAKKFAESLLQSRLNKIESDKYIFVKGEGYKYNPKLE